MTLQEEEIAKQEIAKSLGISKDNIEYKTLSFGVEKRVFECFFVKTKKRMNIPNFINLANYPLVFENCEFDSFICVPSSEIPNVLNFKECTIKKFWALSVKFKSFFEMRDCEIEKIEIYGNSVFEDSVSFEGTKFRDDSLELKRDLKILFYYVEFKKNVYFNKAYFETKFAPSNIIFHQRADFSNAKFKKECDFKQVDFKEDVKFYKAQFKDYTAFKEVKFGDIDFSYVSFDNTYFIKTKFRGYVNFYRAFFKKIPNFSQTIFEKSMNFINTNLDFNFEVLREKIQKEKNDHKEETSENFANDFRDSFRILKNALIKDNNLLEASKYHKFELYAKEIELENKQPQKFSKDWIDKWVLVFYRILCDHHTNLISNLKWLVWLIALYSILLGKVCMVYPIALLGILIYVFGCKKWIFISQITSIAMILCVIFEKPKIIFGVAGLFTSDLNWWQNFITAVYTILMALVLFSFQKTARKNSIVPS